MVQLEDIKKEAEKVLKEGKIKYLIGYKRSNNHLTAAPAFIRDVSEVKSLIWEATCFHNLSLYLVEEKKNLLKQKNPDNRPVGIITKGCDSKAINVLLQEKYINREDVYIIGVSCENGGVIDLKKLYNKFRGKKPKRIKFDKNNHFLIESRFANIKVPMNEFLEKKCIECRTKSPVIYDVLIGDKKDIEKESDFNSLMEIESKSAEERWEFFKNQMNKCIRCYACRSVCPMCYCSECVVDSNNFAVSAETSSLEKAQKIKWIEKSPDLSENLFYHLIRAIHLTGRCIDCNECERVCPVDIPLRYINKKMEKEAKELFGYDAGMDPDKESLISSFCEKDMDSFIR